MSDLSEAKQCIHESLEELDAFVVAEMPEKSFDAIATYLMEHGVDLTDSEMSPFEQLAYNSCEEIHSVTIDVARGEHWPYGHRISVFYDALHRQNRKPNIISDCIHLGGDFDEFEKMQGMGCLHELLSAEVFAKTGLSR